MAKALKCDFCSIVEAENNAYNWIELTVHMPMSLAQAPHTWSLEGQTFCSEKCLYGKMHDRVEPPKVKEKVNHGT